jgi:dimethylhistidine N-methyltransferase
VIAPGTAPAVDEVFAADVAEYLQRQPRQLPSKYFYDPLGSALFEAICRLPTYRIARAESALLERHARDIVAPLASPISVSELGCGSGDKLAILLEHSGVRFPLVRLIDISPAALAMASSRIAAIGAADEIVAHQATYDEGLLTLERERRGTPGAMLVLFLGSNIGNFDLDVGRDLLSRIRRSLRPGDGLLLGNDLVKPVPQLLAAYADPLHVTAAFNRNLLRRINDELGGNFDLDGFAHRAVWNEEFQRVESHLVSRRRQTVRIAAANLKIRFSGGDAIWTESSYKFQPETVVADGLAAGFTAADQWIEQDARFALTRFSV